MLKTGAGKTVTARKIIEGLIEKEYPILIFDPSKDYIGLAENYANVDVFSPKLNIDDESVEIMEW